MPLERPVLPANRPSSTRNGVIFGAGAIGRGFVGEILLDAGWGVTFIDADPDLVAALSAGSYPHDTVSSHGVSRKILTGCTALPAHNADAIRTAVAGAQVIFTSVGASNLPRIAPALSAGLAARHAANGGPVDVFIAENLHDGAAAMHSLVSEELRAIRVPDVAAVMDDVGFVETSIGRMIPVPTAAQKLEHPALVAVEPFRQLPFDLAACRAPAPDVPDLVGDDQMPFSFYGDRKLYIHNHGHCLSAYLGALAGYQEIAPAITDERVVTQVRAGMYATAEALARKYQQPLTHLVGHADDLLERFGNASLHDTVERVGRDPARKLQPGDRFFGTLSLTSEWGDPSVVIPGIALAAHQLILTQAAKDWAVAVAPVRRELSRITPHLVGRFDALLASLLSSAPDGDALDHFLVRLEEPAP